MVALSRKLHDLATVAAGAAAAAVSLAAAAGAAPTPIGLYGRWGVFRDGANCHAVTQARADGSWLAVAGDRLVVAHAGYGMRAGTAVLVVDGTRYPLPAMRADGAAGRALAVALRIGRSATLQATDGNGRVRRDRFPLTGAALALDAAVVACAR